MAESPSRRLGSGLVGFSVRFAVALVAVGSVDDEMKGELAKAYIVLKDGETVTESEIIEFCRASASENGAAPTLREITTGTGISTKELFSLFPKGPAKKVAKIAGLGKPEGCV